MRQPADRAHLDRPVVQLLNAHVDATVRRRRRLLVHVAVDVDATERHLEQRHVRQHQRRIAGGDQRDSGPLSPERPDPVREVEVVVPKHQLLAACQLTGEQESYPLDMDHSYSNPLGIRDGGYSFRTVACPTAGSGYYGMSVADVGPDAFDHRLDPAEPLEETAIRVSTPTMATAVFPTGMLCIPEAESPLAADGDPPVPVLQRP